MNRITPAARPGESAASERVAIAFRWLVLAVAATQMVFAHGCHGDADHELFTAAVAAQPGSAVQNAP